MTPPPFRVFLSTGVAAHVDFIEHGPNVAVIIAWAKNHKPSPEERAAVDRVVMAMMGPDSHEVGSLYFENQSRVETAGIMRKFLKAEDN